MLISHKHRFIFVHVPKNGGTSITNALLPYVTNRWQRAASRFLSRFGILGLAAQPYGSHIKAPLLVSKMGRDVFKSYFSFAIVRNPWDRQVSLYTYTLKDPQIPGHTFLKGLGSFEAYIRWRCAQPVNYQRDCLFADTGEKLVEFIGRYERLSEDFQYICSKIGIRAVLPQLNVSKSKPYQEYYNNETKELVRRTFEPDINLFKYDFE